MGRAEAGVKQLDHDVGRFESSAVLSRRMVVATSFYFYFYFIASHFRLVVEKLIHRLVRLCRFTSFVTVCGLQ